MSIWILLLIVVAAGMVGGFVNALMTENGFVLPKRETTDGGAILRPGFLGNVLIGGVAAGVSWGLYGPLANQVVFPPSAAATAEGGIALAALVGAVLVGVGGARWLTSEVDKKFLKAAATKAVQARDPHAAGMMADASPLGVFKIANEIR
jgi:hypothetical protein